MMKPTAHVSYRENVAKEEDEIQYTHNADVL